jgi:hypothetical protein
LSNLLQSYSNNFCMMWWSIYCIRELDPLTDNTLENYSIKPINFYILCSLYISLLHIRYTMQRKYDSTLCSSIRLQILVGLFQ